MSQMVSEYMRLESRLAGMAIGAEGADHDEVRLRLEIMMSQIELLQEGDLGKFINKSEQRKTVVATLIRNLHLLDKQVDTMTPEQVRQNPAGVKRAGWSADLNGRRHPDARYQYR